MIFLRVPESRGHADHGWPETYHTFSSNTYQQKRFDDAQLQDHLHLVASPDAKDGSLAIHQYAKIYLAKLGIGVVIRHPLSRERHAWLQLMRGTIAVSEHEMAAGDGAAISDETELLIRANSDAEFLLFDLA